MVVDVVVNEGYGLLWVNVEGWLGVLGVIEGWFGGGGERGGVRI